MDITRYIEHTLLKPDAAASDIKCIVNEAIENNFFGVCVNPCYTALAKDLIQDAGAKTKIVTVVNFPLASNIIETTIVQTAAAISDGADEIDTVVNISALKNKDFEKVSSDIRKTKAICNECNLKVILETDLLTKEEIETASKIAAESGADFVKTSTGFVKNGKGATVEDVKLMAATVKPYGLKVKASGGIKTYSQALALIEAGAERLGTSSGVEIVKGMF